MKKYAYGGTKINPERFHKSQIKFYLILIPLALFMILPILYIFSTAFKPLDELFAFPPKFFVRRPTLANFRMLFENTSSTVMPMSRYLFNSIIISLIVVVFTIFISAMAGYALSKKRFRLKNFIFELNTMALMFVATAVTIPRYLLMNQLGILNTVWAHILPLLAMPIGLFLIKQFIDQIPDSLLEAARIDGANEFLIFTKIVLPLIVPALATVAILAFQSTWNNVETSSLFVENENMKTFAFYMSTLTSTGNAVAGQGMAAAASLIMFIPNLIIFIFMQKNVMNTMAHSGIK